MNKPMKPRIAVVGSLNMDLVVQTSRIPKPGETILGAGDLQRIPGGKGANQAYGAAKLGADVAMVGRIGNDMFGESLRISLKEVGINIRHVTCDSNASTGVAIIVVEDSGQNSIVVSSGANKHVSLKDISQAEDVIQSADLLLLQLEIPLPAVYKAAQLARHHGVSVVLNPAPAQPLPADLLSMVDILIPNETETTILSGCEVDTDDGIEKAAAELRQSGVMIVIMTRGSRGSILITDNEVTNFPAFQIKPVDTTAAGDAFVSSFAVAFAEGKSLHEAVRFGNAAGALTSMKLGAQPSMPSRGELGGFIQGK